jgi:TonB family protein
MIAWMAYSVLLGLLLTVAAEALQRLLHLRRRSTRFVWAAALLASIGLPALLPLFVKEQPAAVEPSILPATFSLQIDVTAASAAAPLFTLSDLVMGGWALASALLLVWVGAALLRLARARHRWEARTVAESPVLVSENTGPAVIGFVRPAVVIPRWVCALSQLQQRLVLAHEREHIAARDPLLILLARLLPALLPWNPALWLQSRRLRESVELDCDRRLLARGTNANRYAELLLDVGSRGSASLAAAVTLSEPRSLLEKRIRHMFDNRPRRPLLQTVSCVVLGAAALTLVAAAPRPGEPATPAIVDQQEPFTVAPKLRNADDTKMAIVRNYPPLLRESGIGGQVWVSVKVSAVGNVTDARIRTSSGHEALDAAALRVARQMKFTPAKNRDKVVSASIDVPVPFVANTASLTPQQKIEREKAAATVKETIADLEKVAVKVQELARKLEQEAVLTNREEVRRATERYYPPLLRDAGIDGTAQLSVFVDPSGQVTKTALRESTGHAALDDAAQRVAQVMTFEPSKDGTGRWINTSVSFRLSSQEQEIKERVALAATRADISAAPVFTPMTVRPELVNPAETSQALQSAYPPLLRDAGIGGTVKVWFFIDEAGNVAKLQIKEGSGHAALDDAALKVAAGMKFTSAKNRDRTVSVWVDMPIVFKTQ